MKKQRKGYKRSRYVKEIKYLDPEKKIRKIELDDQKKNLYIFADTETYIRNYDSGGWDAKDQTTKTKNDELNAEVVPGLMCFQYRKVNEVVDEKGNKTYEISKTEGTKDISFYFPDNEEKYWTEENKQPHKKLFQLLYDAHNVGKFQPVLIFHNAMYDLKMFLELGREKFGINYYIQTTDDKEFIMARLASIKYGFTCDVRDSMRYSRRSLAQCGEIIGVPKGSVEEIEMRNVIGGQREVPDEEEPGKMKVEHYLNFYNNNGEPKEVLMDPYVDYCQQDVDVTAKYGEYECNLITQRNELFLGKDCEVDGGPLTQSSHIIKLINEGLKKKYGDPNMNFGKLFCEEVTKEQHEATKKSNCGGFTTHSNVFKYVCNDNQKIYCYDCNSMYPYIMSQPLPYGPLLDEKPEGDYVEGVQIRYHMRDYKDKSVPSTLKGKDSFCKLMGSYPLSANKCFEADKLNTLCIPREYLEYILTIGDVEYYEIRSYYQRKGTHISEFFTSFYDMRMEIKAEMKKYPENSPEGSKLDLQDKNIKEAINAVFGKTCQQSYENDYYYFEGDYVDGAKEKPKRTLILTGAGIAFTGQNMLLKKIEAVHKAGGTFLYADTDSVIFACENEDKYKFKEIFGENTGKMGQWKCEGVFTHFFQPGKKKKYFLSNKYKPKGNTKIAFSGPKGFKSKFKYLVSENFDKHIENMEFIFSPDTNVKLLRCKVHKTETVKGKQPLLITTDFETNKGVDGGRVHAIVGHKGDDYGIRYVGNDD